MVKLLFALLFIFSFGTTLIASNPDELNSPTEELVFSHAQFKLDEFKPLSADYSVGIIKKKFNKKSHLVLFDKHHLSVDTLLFSEQVENLIIDSDSSFFIVNKDVTYKYLVRNDQLLFNGQYIGLSESGKNKKLALYTFPTQHFQLQLNTAKAKGKTEFAEILHFDESKKQEKIVLSEKGIRFSDIEIANGKDEVFLFCKKDPKLLIIDKHLKASNTCLDGLEKSDWEFHYDAINSQAYLLKIGKEENELYALNKDGEKSLIRKLSFVPIGIHGEYLFLRKKLDGVNAFYRTPIDEQYLDPSKILQEVNIQSE